MRRLIIPFVVVGATAASLCPAAAATPAPAAGAACREPTVERAYDGERFAVRLAVDLSGCDWWDGGPIQLFADLSRLAVTGEEGAGSFTVCGVRPITQDPGGAVDDDWASVTTCEVSVGLDHPPVEVARYHGEVTYPWEGGERTAGFAATCVSAALSTCRDDP